MSDMAISFLCMGLFTALAFMLYSIDMERKSSSWWLFFSGVLCCGIAIYSFFIFVYSVLTTIGGN